MMIHSRKLTSILLIGVFTGLIAFVVISCGTAEPTSTPVPIASTTTEITDTPEPPAPTEEPSAHEEASAFLLPSATPAPTLGPDVVAEMISDFTEAQGLDDVTFFQVKVEDWLNLGYSIIIITVIGFLLSRFVQFVLTWISAKTKTQYDDIFIKRIRWQIALIIVTFGFQVGTVRLSLLEVLTKIKITRLYTVIYVIAVTMIIWHLIDILVDWYQNEVQPQKTEPRQVDTILLLLHRFARILLITISLITLLSLYNVNVNALVAALGVGGLALSLAAQDTLSNVISGIMIMVDQPFRVGDRIEIPKMNTWGDVVDIGLRSTRIRTRDNRMVIVPNNIISTDQVVNYSYPDPQYRIQIEVGVSYGQDIDKVRQVMVDAVRKVEGVLVERPVDALYVTMGDSAMIFRVRWWIESYRDTRYMFDRVNTTIQKAFDENGIEMAINTLGIHIFNKQRDEDDDSLHKG